MPADTVTVDRAALLALMTEAYAVTDILEGIAGCNTAATSDLDRLLEAMLIEVFGPFEWDENQIIGPHAEIMDAGRAEAQAFFGSLAGEAVTADVS